MQAPRPSPGLLHPNLPFNKIPKGSTDTLKCAKSFQWLHSLGDFRDECAQGLSQRECCTTLSGLRKLVQKYSSHIRTFTLKRSQL